MKQKEYATYKNYTKALTNDDSHQTYYSRKGYMNMVRFLLSAFHREGVENIFTEDLMCPFFFSFSVRHKNICRT